MKRFIKNTGLLLGLFCLPLLAMAGTNSSPRNTVSLDGTWEIAEGSMEQIPDKFDHLIPVPGLVSLAQPPFVGVGRNSKLRTAFWYRRTFELNQPIPAVAQLKVSKAMFGSRVILNGKQIGDHAPSFTPGYFEVKEALRPGKNELLIRVGSYRNSVDKTIPSGADQEKQLYIPGIFDSVELILTGSPYIRNVQAAPDIKNKTVRVQAVVYSADNGDTGNKGNLKFTVRERISGAVVGTFESPLESLAAGTEKVVDVSIPVANYHLWSPEDPFLYDLSVESSADRFDTRFGMREFHFDSATGRAVLNGKPYFMRGSNITLYRFFEDEKCKDLPWNEQWVRDLHLSFKKFHWNSLRYCIGFPPEKWYQIADEVGILIQDEFPFWSDPNGPTTEELVREYTEWMQERWNHPCVVLWDAQNESRWVKTTGEAIHKVRGLDLSDRPWDNGYAMPDRLSDPIETHPYHYHNPKFKLKDMARENVMPLLCKTHRGIEPHAIVVNEYGWLWVNRDGTPTKLTAKLFDNLLGPNATAEQRFYLAARYLAADTEFWRCHRKCAGVMEFTALGYSRPDGATSDQFIDVEKLVYFPDFEKYVSDAFAPVGLMVDYWNDKAEVGASVKIPVIVINDLEEPWSGPVTLRILNGDKVVSETAQPVKIEPYGQAKFAFDISFPTNPGNYIIQAELKAASGNPVKSLRDIELLKKEDLIKAVEAEKALSSTKSK